MGLEEYRRKRDFGRTPEPPPRVGRSDGGALEYVVQKHDASQLHYDFRLELDGVLKSWAVPKGPSMRAGVRRLAMETEDHPLEYGGFEGVIPEGEYGGGTVMIWDRGVWVPESDPGEGYRNGRLRFRLEGAKLSGAWILTRMAPKPGERRAGWLLIKSRDGAARKGAPEITEAQPLSATTGRDLDEIAADRDRVWGRHGERGADEREAEQRGGEDREGEDREGEDRGNEGRETEGRGMEASGERPAVGTVRGVRKARLPGDPRVQLASAAAEAPAGDEWLHEIKFDGYRVLARIEDGDVGITTRNGKDWTDRFAGIAEALAGLPCDRALVDGEVVVLDRRGVPSFQALQNALSRGARGARGREAGGPLLYAFDLLHLDGHDLTGAALEDRKAVLEALVAGAPVERVRYSDHVRGRGPEFFGQACGMGLEGVISKRAGRPYQGGRGRDWLKVKCTARQEFVVVGYTDPSGTRAGFGALVLGVHDEGGRLVYAGRVGTGFDTRLLLALERRLSAMRRTTPAVTDPPRGAQARGVHWVEPTLVAEVEFTEWTEDGRIRHPSFQGLREDKDVSEVTREPAGRKPAGGPVKAAASGSSKRTREGEFRVAGIRITSPDRVVWAEQGVTKGELAEYYAAVEDAILPRLRDRPLTLVRCPSGAGESCFYQKHANDSVPAAVPRVMVSEKDGREPYMYVDGLPALLSLVQLGVLEFHVWGARRDRLDRPDRLVFDLDPDEDLPFGRVVRAAFRLREVLGELGLESWPKGTGGKGLHVVVPITRRIGWDHAREFTRAVAEALVAEDPKGFTARMAKRRRTGRIFVDYLRNARNATAIAEYSTRARPGAPVAVPMAWDELSVRSRTPPLMSVRDVLDGLADRKAAWEGFDMSRQSITAAMRQAVGMA